MQMPSKKMGIALVCFAALSLGIMIAAHRLSLEHGLNGTYYRQKYWSGEPFSTAVDQTFDLQRMSTEFPSITINYSIRWTGFLRVPRTGTYVFATASDDDSYLHLDGKLLIDNGGIHGLVEQTQAIRLTKGLHPITIEYSQSFGVAALAVYWTRPGGSREMLSSDVLYTAPISPWRSFLEPIIFAARNVVSTAWLAMIAGGVLFGLRRTFRTINAKAALQNALLVVCSFFLGIGMLELVLRTGYFDDKGTLWTREKYRKINEEINQKNQAYAALNPYSFTDRVWDERKPAGTYRVAVLGDSFIWGYGLPYEQAWGHKLAQKIAERYQQVEVLNWGFSGWSTVNELAFLETEGVKFDIDALIVGYVRNDPDLGNFTWKIFDLQTMPQWYVQTLCFPVKTLFPNAFGFIAAHVNELLTNYWLNKAGYGWNAWYNLIYSQENLARYLLVLQQMADFCKAHHIRLLFALTPSSSDNGEKKRLELIHPLLERAQIEYLDLHPPMERELGAFPPRQLWANFADAHPGELMTELFARETLAYLEQQAILPRQYAKREGK